MLQFFADNWSTIITLLNTLGLVLLGKYKSNKE